MTAGALQKLGKYQVRGTLGKGAMGVVYDGFDPIIERRVAIKTIAKDTMDPDEAAELLARFKREAQAAGRLNHPGIVSIYDYGEDEGLAFIAMEYIKGKELKKYFDDYERFDLAHLVHIMCSTLDALDHAHRNGVVHRDIKPANIMITDEGRVKVADFGVARIESSMMTQVGTRIGTPAYMSPEQHQGLKADGRSDVFSAGVILYQFLTGERPFTGGGYTIIQQILKQDPIPPSEINFAIPRALDVVVSKALAKRPEDRFQSAREFAETLKEAAAGEAASQNVDFPLDAEAPPAPARQAAPAAQPTRAAPPSAAESSTADSTVSLEAEVEYWKEIKDSTDADDFVAFLRAFPGSRFAPLARRRMVKLETDAPQVNHDSTVVQQTPKEQAKVRIAPSLDSQNRIRHEAEEQKRRAAEERAKREVEERHLRDAEEKARREEFERQAEVRAKREAEEQAELAKAEGLRKEAEAKREADERKEAEEKAKRDEQRPTDVRPRPVQADATRESPRTVEPERKKVARVRAALVAVGVLVAVGLALIIHQGLHLMWGFEEQGAIMAQIERIDAKEREIEAKLAAAKSAGQASSEFAIWTEIRGLSMRHVFRSDALRRVRQHVAPTFLLARLGGSMREALHDLREARSSAERLDTLFGPIEQAVQARGRLSEAVTELTRIGEQEKHDVSRDVKAANEARTKSEALLNEANFAEALEVSQRAEGDTVRSLNTLIDDFVAKYSALSERGLAAGQLDVARIALERAKALSALKRTIQ